MKLKRITMITFLFFTALTPIYAQTHGLYTMDEPYAFGAGYNLELEKTGFKTQTVCITLVFLTLTSDYTTI